MTVCKQCHREMDDSEIKKDSYGEYVCPYCGSDELSEAVRCALCDEWTPEEECRSCFTYLETPPRMVFFCEDCSKRTIIEFDRMVKENFGAMEQVLLEGEGLYGDIT